MVVSCCMVELVMTVGRPDNADALFIFCFVNTFGFVLTVVVRTIL